MKPVQRKRANALIRNTCCNYENGNCLLLDDGDTCTCPQTISYSVCCKWFPQMENFSGQLKKYKVTIADLLEENKKLEVRAKASKKGKLKDTMERAKLESELHNIQRLVERIPPDVLAELKRQQHDRKED